MTEPENPQKKQNRGIFRFLGKRKKQRRAFHIPTAPATAVRLVQNLNRKGASSTAVPDASPGSFFDWKRLGLRTMVVSQFRASVKMWTENRI